jgi:hypothetical protein
MPQEHVVRLLTVDKAGDQLAHHPRLLVGDGTDKSTPQF